MSQYYTEPDVAQYLQALDERVSNLERMKLVWVAPALLNSWANVGAPYDLAAYGKDPLGFVHFRGRIHLGASATTALKLPLGFRPRNANVSYPVAAFNSATPVVANAAIPAGTGELQIYFGGANMTDVSLTGVSFLAEE